ncbi:MAG: hypothetical protein VSS75_009950, partial [Candidatus Parabeggiatoa sp.]|nr:hypothetical protein [Candidatus Parabeggiatoa sp.]
SPQRPHIFKSFFLLSVGVKNARQSSCRACFDAMHLVEIISSSMTCMPMPMGIAETRVAETRCLASKSFPVA